MAGVYLPLSRTSQEVRELKLDRISRRYAESGRTSQEVRELKLICPHVLCTCMRRTSQEVRELKSAGINCIHIPHLSHLARGA